MDDLRLCQRDFKKLAKDATVFVGVSVKALVSTPRHDATDEAFEARGLFSFSKNYSFKN